MIYTTLPEYNLFPAFALAGAQVFDVPPWHTLGNQKIRYRLRLRALHRNLLQAKRLFTARQWTDRSTSGAESL